MITNRHVFLKLTSSLSLTHMADLAGRATIPTTFQARITVAAGLFGKAVFRHLATLLSGNTTLANALRVTLKGVLTEEVDEKVSEHVNAILGGMNASIKKCNTAFLV